MLIAVILGFSSLLAIMGFSTGKLVYSCYLRALDLQESLVQKFAIEDLNSIVGELRMTITWYLNSTGKSFCILRKFNF